MLIMKTHSIAVLFVVCMGGLFSIESLHAQDFWSVHWLPSPCAVPDVILDNKGNLFVACDQGGLLRSTNGGKTFEKLVFSPWLFYRFEKNAADHIYIGTADAGISKTSNLGVLWEKIGLDGKKVVDIEIIHDTVLFVGAQFEGVYRSYDDGANWEMVFPYTTGALPRLTFEKTSSTLYCSVYGKLFKTTDLGE